ncbi:type II secretion system protein GspM [Sulfitobacter sabulilitoris]|uniref:type II secretion system protein GspM n=1 Tax=Sulfitobacter sabulilitoris TaxID=2562655 RepID=UPI001478903A|nr:type II secretion system protein M [Sulfitobacter sabulilitoris]
MIRFSSLSRRERLLVGVALPVLAGAALFHFAWLPVQSGRAALRADIVETKTIRALLDATPQGAPTVQAARRDLPPVTTRVTRSAEAANLSLSRLEPEGDLLRVSVDTAPFVAVVDWLMTLERDQGLRIAAVEMDRRPEPGTVSLRLTLEPDA